MKKNQDNVSKQTLYLAILIVFIAGFIAGVTFTVVIKQNNSSVPAPSTADGREQTSPEESTAIRNLEAEVTANPDNYNAWIQLGHLYFDTNQFEKAIVAYTTSLQLHSGSADLWTDLGIMYRRTGKPTKAIEAFDKAISLDAGHLQSRFNKGIVLYFDMGRTAEALTSWQSVLAINPSYRTADNTPLTELIERIRQGEPDATDN